MATATLRAASDEVQGVLARYSTTTNPAQRAMEGVMLYGHHEEAPVLGLVCRLLRLPLALLVVDSSLDSSKWSVAQVCNTAVDGSPVEWSSAWVNPAVRLAVLYATHYSPCVLCEPLPATLVPPCRTFVQVLEALCAEVHALPPAVLTERTLGGGVEVRDCVAGCC